MKIRTYARHLALKVLYQNHLSGTDIDEAFSATLEIDEMSMAPDAYTFSRDLVAGVREHRQYLDTKISAFVEDSWDFKRLGLLEKLILRIAAFEILYIESIPVKVSINEAVEMTKIYLSVEASKLVNGVLHKFTRANEPQGLDL